MKELVITDGKEIGYKKPILWVEEGNQRIKIASFNNEEAVNLFIEWSKENNFEIEEIT